MFIVITGGDRCGKTTQCGLLASRLREMGSGVYEAKVPDTTTEVGQAIRKILKTMKLGPTDSKNLHERTILEALFVVDRLHTEKLIDGEIKAGNIVVCSRWAESAGAYAEASDFYAEWHDRLVTSSRRPDLTILIDVPSQYDSRSVSSQEALEAYDRDYEFQRRVREWLRNYPDIVRVDGSRSPEAVAESVWKVVVTKLLELATNEGTSLVDRELRKLVQASRES